MCIYCYHIIITFCYKVNKIQEKNSKVSQIDNNNSIKIKMPDKLNKIKWS